MAFGVKHTHQTTIPDDPSRDVSATEWNQVHTIDTAIVLPPQDEDPSPVANGTIWYNSDEGVFKLHYGGKTVVVVPLTDGDKGDIEVTSDGAVWLIDDDAVTNAKLAPMNPVTLKGNNNATNPLNPKDLTVTQVKAMLNYQFSEIGGSSGAAQEPARTTGDVTNPAGSLVMTIAPNAVTTAKIADKAVTNAKLADVGANTLKGNNSTAGVPKDLTVPSVKAMLGYTAADISGLGALATQDTVNLTTQATGVLQAAQMPAFTGDVTKPASSLVQTIAAKAVTLAKMADVGSGYVFYRKTTGAGAPEVQPLATLKSDLGVVGSNTGDQTITLTNDVTGSGTGMFATTIVNGAVTNAKLADMGAKTIKGAIAAGDPVDLTGTQATSLLDVFSRTLKGLVPPSSGTNGTANFLREDGLWVAPGVGGGAALTDGDKGDVIVSASGATWMLDYPAVNAAVAPTWAKITGKPTISGTNTGDQTITLTQDVTGSGTGSFPATLATVNSNVGSFGLADKVAQFVVNAKGLITSAGNVAIAASWALITGKPTTVATSGLTDAVSLAGVQTLTNKTMDRNNNTFLNMSVQDMVNSGYLDQCRMVAVVPNSLTGAGAANAVSGIQTVVGDRILVTAQADPIQNGIYIVQTGAWTRAPDAAVGSSNIAGSFTTIRRGTPGAGTQWATSFPGSWSIGTDPNNWFQVMRSDNVVKQTSSHDATAGSLLTNFTAGGSFGWGHGTVAGNMPDIGNFDAFAIAAGHYRVTGSTLGTRPPGIPYSGSTGSVTSILILNYSSTACVQIMFNQNAATPSSVAWGTWIRNGNAGLWSPWRSIDGMLDDGTIGPPIIPALSFGLDPDTGIYRPSSNVLGVSTGGTEVARFSGNNLFIGSANQIDGTPTVGLLRAGSAAGANALLYRYGTAPDTAGPSLYLGKSHGADTVTHGIALIGDTIGNVVFCADDGSTGLRNGAFIQAVVDAAPSATGMPTRLMFNTAALTGATVERLRIDSGGISTFSVGGLLAGRVDATGATITPTDGQTLITAQKGDARYINVAGTGLFADGTAAKPSISFSSDTNTGIYSDLPDTIKFTTNGTWAMSLTAANQIYIGSANDIDGVAAGRINIKGTTVANASINLNLSNTANANAAGLNFSRSSLGGVDTDGIVAANVILGNLRFHGADGTNMVYAANMRSYVVRSPVANSGQVIGGLQFMTGAGSGAPVTRLDIDDVTVQANLPILVTTGAANAYVAINANAAVGKDLLYQTAGKNRWSLESNQVAESGSNAGSNFNLGRWTDAGVYIDSPIYITRSTGVVAFSQAIVNGPSDATLKGNIAPLEGALAKVEALQGRRFNMLTTPDKLEIGLIAQEVAPVVPEVIQTFDMVDHETGESTPKLAVDYPKLTALLIEAVKELSAKVATLEAQATRH